MEGRAGCFRIVGSVHSLTGAEGVTGQRGHLGREDNGDGGR